MAKNRNRTPVSVHIKYPRANSLLTRVIRAHRQRGVTGRFRSRRRCSSEKRKYQVSNNCILGALMPDGIKFRRDTWEHVDFLERASHVGIRSAISPRCTARRAGQLFLRTTRLRVCGISLWYPESQSSYLFALRSTIKKGKSSEILCG